MWKTIQFVGTNYAGVNKIDYFQHVSIVIQDKKKSKKYFSSDNKKNFPLIFPSTLSLSDGRE